MITYKVKIKNSNDDIQITAVRYTHDGSGVKFYGEEGIIASFYDGEVLSVVDTQFIQEPTNEEEE